MIKRFSNYLLNSMKVAIIGFCWFILFQVPWESLPKAPLGGKLIAAMVVWAVWSFMVMIVSVEIGKKNGTEADNKQKPKVLVIDDKYFIFSTISRTLDFCDVKHEYCIPEDESTLAEYDVLIVDGDGIGNSKYKHGMEFCKAYAKQGNNKGMIYYSGLAPYGENEKALVGKGVKILTKGGDLDRIVEAVREVVA